MPEFTNTSMVEFSILGDVAGCLWSNAIKAGRMPIDVFPLFRSPHVSDSSAGYTTLRIVFHFVWIGQFLFGVSFTGRCEGQSLR